MRITKFLVINKFVLQQLSELDWLVMLHFSEILHENLQICQSSPPNRSLLAI